MPDTPDTLPTCWYCPECGECARDPRTLSVYDDNLGVSYHLDRGNPCPGELVKAPIFPPDALRSPAGLREVLGLLGLNTREGIYFDPPRFGVARPEVTLGSGKSSHPTVAKYEHPCLVVVLPSGPATKEEDDA